MGASSSSSNNPDVVIIGAGIVGLATGMALTKAGARVTLIEKEPSVGTHQTGHNSGVLHTGIYYRPGSLKAHLCVEGRRQMIQFCEEHRIPLRVTGKLVVATSPDEVPALEELQQRAVANGVEGVTRLNRQEMTEVEPHVHGLAALYVPGAGVVNYRGVAAAMQKSVESLGGSVVTGVKPMSAARRNGRWTIDLTDSVRIETPLVVTCAGLHADTVGHMFGVAPEVRIVPFRGEYWHLRRPDLVRSMIYPVPDPRFPFLGVHFTRGIDDAVEVGPNAVLAFSREGYSWARVVPAELWTILRTPGLRRLAGKYWRTGSAEIARSLIAPLLVRAARNLVPAVGRGDLIRAGAGVRAQALSRGGNLVDDFVFGEAEGVLSVLNAPSPAATASIAIGEHIALRVAGPSTLGLSS